MDKRIVQWDRVDTVLLDMDGTLLDLHYDNCFWSEHLPRRYAEHHQLEIAESNRRLAPVFSETSGSLKWYSTDFWSEVTGLDVVALKREIADLIGPLPGARRFLEAVQASGRRIWLVTNAHPDSVALKLERTGLAPYFELVLSSHEFGWAKEQVDFWPTLAAVHPFDRERALFVDDSPAVIANAVAYGIGQVVALTHPDSRDSVRAQSHSQVARRVEDFIPEPDD